MLNHEYITLVWMHFESQSFFIMLHEVKVKAKGKKEKPSKTNWAMSSVLHLLEEEWMVL